MLLIAALLSAIFIGIGRIVNRQNARVLLSGYNTLSAADQEKVDIEGYMKLFRKFHQFLGVSIFGGTALLSFWNENASSIFMTVLPLIAYLYLILKGRSFFSGVGSSKAGLYVAFFIIGFVTMLILIFSIYDYRSSEIVLSGPTLEIKGSFGVKILRKDIDSVALLKQYPEISWKTYGFAAGSYAKGDFRLKNGSAAKMYINKNIEQVIWLRNKGKDVYFNSDEMDMDSLYHHILKWKMQ